MNQRLSATEARVHFGELLRRVSQNGESFVVERSGEPSAVVLPLEEYRRLQELESSHDDLEVLDRLRALRDRIETRRGRRPMPSPEEMLRDSREARDEVLDEFV